MAELSVLPLPRVMRMKAGAFVVPKSGWVVLDLSAVCAGQAGFNIAEQLVTQLEALTGVAWMIVRDGAGVEEGKEIRCGLDAGIEHAQGYRISIGARGVSVKARTQVGFYYAMLTLVQIARQSKKKWAALEIEDWPDFERRGIYHDCARGKVPELGTILQLIDDMAQFKINEFQLYVENAYAFRRHPAMYGDTTPLTGEELMMIDAYCKARFIDFVPSLTSLGHFEKILGKAEYRHLGEVEPEALKKAGMEVWWDAPWTLNVTDAGAKQLLKEMYDEFLPNFTSSFFNICCDESFDLGKGKSKDVAERLGVAQLYVDWVKYCNMLAKGHGRTIMMWGDIIRDHPEKLEQMPGDAVMLEWGYEAGHDFDKRLKVFAKAGLRFYVCPGTSSWQSLTGRSSTAFGNNRAAAVGGKKHGAMGYLNTDWGDFGHQQMLAVSLLPMAMGAAMAWNAKMPDAQVLRGASVHLFGDEKGTFAKLVYDLGMMFEKIGHQRGNASVEFWLLREAWEGRVYLDRVPEKGANRVIKAVEVMVKKLRGAEIGHVDRELIVAELVHSAHAVKHAAERTLVRKAGKVDKKVMKRLKRDAEALRGQFVELWMARNKVSRMEDVVKEWDRLIGEYAARGG